jgi:glycosyltransferase involved in cell wall biosynthesis
MSHSQGLLIDRVISPEPIELSIVIPCYNESEVLPALRDRLLKCLGELGVTWEVIFVDDGSRDTTLNQLADMHRIEPRFKALSFSRNFGHQAALSAGLAYASGRAVGIMDADLQDPPELFVKALDKLRAGFDVVYAVRTNRKENIFKRLSYSVFYRILRFATESDIPLDAGDFCLMSRRVVNILRNMPEHYVFLRGLRAWTGFRQFGLEYEREARAAGATKYPFRKLLRLAADGIFSFSTLPLRFATYLGFLGLALSMIAGVFVLAWRIFGFEFMGHRAADLPGWTALVGVMLFFGGLQFVILGCLGEYIGRIYGEVKQRPRWIVRDVFGLPGADEQPLPRTLP